MPRLRLGRDKALGLLHLDVEGWDTYALRGAGVALHGVDDTCFVVCEVSEERDRKRRNIALSDANVLVPLCKDVLAAMVEHVDPLLTVEFHV